jgi:hypothetical protein
MENLEVLPRSSGVNRGRRWRPTALGAGVTGSTVVHDNSRPLQTMATENFNTDQLIRRWVRSVSFSIWVRSVKFLDLPVSPIWVRSARFLDLGLFCQTERQIAALSKK